LNVPCRLSYNASDLFENDKSHAERSNIHMSSCSFSRTSWSRHCLYYSCNRLHLPNGGIFEACDLQIPRCRWAVYFMPPTEHSVMAA
jgi:hypothetical protein